MLDELLTLDEVAAKLKVSRETARRLCTSGKLPFVPVGTGSDRHIRRVRSSTLAAFVAGEKKNSIRQEMRNVRETLSAMNGVEVRW